VTVDRSIHRFVLDHRSGVLTLLFKLATHLGSSAVLAPLVIVLGVACWTRRRSFLPLALLVSSYAGALVLETALKHLVGRARPPVADRLVQATGDAFPSGHATVGTAVWIAIAVLAMWGLRDRTLRRVVVALAGAVIVAVDLSRVYLGVHWPSDVVAGSLIGGAWTAAVVAVAFSLVGRDRMVHSVAVDPASGNGRG
jgi:undecaprenyl-diphosphatase